MTDLEKLRAWLNTQEDLDVRGLEQQKGVCAAWTKLGEVLDELQRQSDDELLAELGGPIVQRDPPKQGPPVGGPSAQPRAPVATEQVQDIYDTTAQDLTAEGGPDEA